MQGIRVTGGPEAKFENQLLGYRGENERREALKFLTKNREALAPIAQRARSLMVAREASMLRRAGAVTDDDAEKAHLTTRAAECRAIADGITSALEA